jgi:predicted nucleic acid-binding protein
MMILVDTSVLIDFFKNATNAATEKLEYAIRYNIPFGITNLIYLELLQGTRAEKDYEKLKTYLDSQIFYDLKEGRESYCAVAEIYRKCRRYGITVNSTIDILIVQVSVENNLLLLHNDSDYVKIQKIVSELKFY